MAIKTVSKLDPYDNSIDETLIGGNFHLYAQNNANDSNPRTSDSQGSSSYPALNFENNNDYNLLFEISKPATMKGAAGLVDTEFESYKITYKDLAKNIILDTKSYLNTRNNLNDYDLYLIVNGDYTFTGNKTFNGNVNISQNLTVGNKITTRDIDVSNKADIKNAEITNLTVDTTCKIKCDVDASYLTGGAYCLKNNDATHSLVNCGTYNGTITTGLSGATSRTGDPVMFYVGKPYELTCVNNATNAKQIVNSDGSLGSCGRDGVPIYLLNGVFHETNTVNHALSADMAKWADLGERYIPDQVYEPGTLVEFNGEKEITIAKTEVNAVVSTKAFELNCQLEGGIPIALCGRVPVKILGKVDKFDKIVLSSTPGIGRTRKWYEFWKTTIGIALQKSDEDGIKLIECSTRISF